jgi:hypothetical protein
MNMAMRLDHTVLSALVLVFASALSAQKETRPEPGSAVAASPSGQAGTQQAPATPLQEAMAATARRYDAASWQRGERRAGLALGAVELRGYAGGAVEHAHPGPLQRSFADQAGENRVLIEAYVENDAAGAEQRLIWWLTHVSKPGLVPTAASGNIPVGDVAYVGWSAPQPAPPAQRRIAWLAFVRGNVAVRACCLDPGANPHPDMAAVAQTVDAAILGEPVVAAETPLPRPVLERFTARAQCTAGDVIPLALKVTDAAGTAAPRFVIEGPGQGYVEQDAKGTWQLHTTRAGRTTVHLHATGARGLVASSKLVIDVAERR